tara:strand:+ start:94 stop:606 length:513 start_codon:yes stop_codon:yes gene_type:complete
MDNCLRIYTKGEFDQNFLKDIYSINQDNVPEVGSIESMGKMKELISISSYHSIFLEKDNLIGFSICFREACPYWSENYKYFEKELDQFLYVDRIAIDQKYRRQGHAKRMYEDIFNFASKDDLVVTAEVNTKPMNPDSLSFHEYMGFKEVGQRSFDDHDVAYLIANASKKN